MPRHTPSRFSLRTAPRFRKHLLALAAGTALAPAWGALDLVQSPPGTVVPYIRPNVILSLDDSTSMNNGMNDANGNYLGTRREVLMKAVEETFNDTNLLPTDNPKIRLAWQSMNECTQLDNKGAGDLLEETDATATTSTKMNLMRLYEGTHRSNFIRYIKAYRTRSQSGWKCDIYTYTHSLVKAADDYMRAPTHKNGPWSSNPGGSDTASGEYLGCRRNYHIVLTDGEWNRGMTNVKDPANKNYDGERSYWPSHIATATDAQTQLYRDRQETYSSIADWAFYSWANPLKKASELTGSLETSLEYRMAPATETFENRVSKTKATLDRYWNPRYNPATWPHLVTFTIGFSTDALPENNYKLNGSSHDYVNKITKPTSLVPYGYDGNFADYANGTYRWHATKDKGHDMWHAAINGRGQFYAVEKGEDLKKAFQEIIGTIKTATEPDMTSTATSGSNSTRLDVGSYTGNYEPKNHWKGFVTSKIQKKDGTTVDNPAWGGKNTADKLDAMAATARKILTWSDKRDNTGKEMGGIPFKWDSVAANFSTAQHKQLGDIPGTAVTVAKNAQNRLNYIRGESTFEGTESPANYPADKPFRQRKSKQGDIINSVVWYTGAPSSDYNLKGYSSFVSSNRSRKAMIYVGGNDGMLHGFAAEDGSEKIAYVPKGIIPRLYRLTEATYNAKGHRNFVDGSPMTGDVDMGIGVQDPEDPDYNPNYTSSWRTLLVGTLGTGGRGYFVLDVTNPETFDDTAAIAKQMVILDRTRSAEDNDRPDCSVLTGTAKTSCEKALAEDKDVGHITATPVLDDVNPMQTTQITRMNNNRWAVVFGNGYNSDNERPVLLVQYLDNNKELLRIPVVGTVDAPPAEGTPSAVLAKDNGLSAPRLMDINSDGRPDIAYAGDNQGNLWKFDLTNIDDQQWKVAFNGKPLFTALGPIALNATTRTVPQPITVAPTAVPNDRKMEVGSGTSKTTVDVGGMMVSFGTGRNVTTQDPSDINVQSLYSVLDNTRYRTVEIIVDKATGKKVKRLEVHPGGGTCTPIPQPNCAPAPQALGTGVVNAKLVKRSVTDSSSGEYGTMDTIASSDVLDEKTWNSKNGWYMDFPAIGERLLKNTSLYDNSNILMVFSQIPAKGSDKESNKESCDAVSPDEERQFMTMVNIMDGEKPSVQIMDINGDSLFDALDNNANRMKISKGSNMLISTGKDTNTLIDNNDKKKVLARLPEQSMRPSWRQLK